MHQLLVLLCSQTLNGQLLKVKTTSKKVLNLIESDFRQFGIDSNFESVRYLLDDLKPSGFFKGSRESSPAHEL